MSRLQRFDPRSRVGNERVDQRRAIGTLGPLERGSHAILQSERTIREPGRIGAARPLQCTPGGAEDDAQHEQRARRGQRQGADGALEREQRDGEQRRPEQAAQGVMLDAPPSHLRADLSDESLERRVRRHRTNGSRACVVVDSTLSTI